jgi:hypothetical protein
MGITEAFCIVVILAAIFLAGEITDLSACRDSGKSRLPPTT